MDEMMNLNRRAMLQSLGLLLGAASVPTEAATRVAMKGKGVLDTPRLKLLSAIADTIIPATDTPGAIGVQVPKLLSGLMRDWASEATRAELIKAIDDIGALAPKGKFATLGLAQRTALLTPYDKAAVQPGPPRKVKLKGLAAMMAGPPLANPSYVRLKDLIINLYYSSEIAMTKEIVYEHIPGKFVPSLPITPGTRPYAGLGGPF
jgi:gluconate 2-dehydrogenase gamma chain